MLSKNLILGDLAQWQGEEAFAWDEELRHGAVIGDHGGDNTERTTGLSKVGLQKN